MLGGDGSGVRDSVVNQLLAKMDGIKVKSGVYYTICYVDLYMRCL